MYSPASLLPLLGIFNCFFLDKICPDFVHVIEGRGSPEASQLKEIGFVLFTVMFRGSTVNWIGTMQKKSNNLKLINVTKTYTPENHFTPYTYETSNKRLDNYQHEVDKGKLTTVVNLEKQ